MPRVARRPSESGIYHVTARGVGRQLIFEDDRDREELLSALADEGDRLEVRLLAWCFMGNHIHLLVQSGLDDLAAYMRRVLGRYAMFFNVRHARSGRSSRTASTASRYRPTSTSSQRCATFTTTPPRPG